MNYDREVEDDARDFLENNDEAVKTALCDGANFDDIEDIQDRIHEEITDRSYTAEDALFVLRNCENEETDSGLWEGVEGAEEQLSIRAAYSYSMDVWFKAKEIYDDLKERVDDAVTEKDEENKENDDYDADETKDKIINAVWDEWVDERRIKPIPAGGEKEMALIEEWQRRSKDAGFFGGYPVGSSYIDARCGTGFGMPDTKDFVDFDHEVAHKLPHLAGKYRDAVEDHLKTLQETVKAKTDNATHRKNAIALVESARLKRILEDAGIPQGTIEALNDLIGLGKDASEHDGGH